MKDRELSRFENSGGDRIYRIPLDIFPGMHGYAHLVITKDLLVLFDVGSGFGDSNEQLEAGLEQINVEFKENAGWDRITHILISHAHIDHYGGLHYVRERTSAPIGIHELDRRVLTNYEERLEVIEPRFRAFLLESGVPESKTEELVTLYLLHKMLFSSIEVDFSFEALGMRLNGLEFVHVPGHCSGQVVARVGDILLSADHILEQTSPHMAPESLSLNTGLEHYLASLQKVAPLTKQVRLALGGHEGPIEDPEARIEAIIAVHRERLNQILDLLDTPATIYEVSQELFPETEVYHQILAVEETAAHFEYLYSRGFVELTNLDDIEVGGDTPRKYVRRQIEESVMPALKGGSD
ncbi:MAG: MBL fold metallo-hydrolase [Anaerolineales bacterium]|jgi:glyoxylase-like metal-dependent hydrolase (beta-lactamase superfamily II)|nr:MAG: MBL fold metallo-hydrolase [Anaerolineales bacterium]